MVIESSVATTKSSQTTNLTNGDNDSFLSNKSIWLILCVKKCDDKFFRKEFLCNTKATKIKSYHLLSSTQKRSFHSIDPFVSHSKKSYFTSIAFVMQSIYEEIHDVFICSVSNYRFWHSFMPYLPVNSSSIAPRLQLSLFFLSSLSSD